MKKYYRITYFVDNRMVTKYIIADNYKKAVIYAHAVTTGVLSYNINEITFSEYYRSVSK